MLRQLTERIEMETRRREEMDRAREELHMEEQAEAERQKRRVRTCASLRAACLLV